MKLSPEFIEKLKEHIQNGYVNETLHPSLPLKILCYSKGCQYEALWDEVTTRCRGMIVDFEYNIVANVTPKFFNHGSELERLGINPPNLPYTVYEKMDGSLIHMWFYDGKWNFSSKGSFIWENLEVAKSIFEERYHYGCLNTHYTYCFELISPENKIVVDYKGKRDLVLLNIIDSYGKEISPHEIKMFGEFFGFSLPKVYDCEDFTKLKEEYSHLKGTEHEGFVIRYSNGFRMKVKLDNYLVLHRIFSNFSPLTFWESVDLNTLKIKTEFLESLPEEFQSQTEKIVNSLESQMLTEWDRIEKLAKSCPNFENNKERFLYLNEHFPLDKHQIVTYLYGKYNDVREMIWKKFRPTGNVLKEE